MVRARLPLAGLAVVDRRITIPASEKAADRFVDRQTGALAAAYLCSVHNAADLEAKLRPMVERARTGEFPLGGNDGVAEALEVVIGDLDRIERARQKAA
jgi:hypothetical protein